MITITIQRGAVNIEALDAEVRAALGALTSGIGITLNGVQVYLVDTATPAQIAQARALLQAHDPARQTPAQQAAAARKAKLDGLRQDVGNNDLDLTPYNGQAAVIRVLAQKIAWLEQEIAALRAGL
jgi:hypothetical protein